MTSHGVEMEEEEDLLEEDEFQLARSYFDMKEFDRVAHTLKNAHARGSRARFLRAYSLYLVSKAVWVYDKSAKWHGLIPEERKMACDSAVPSGQFLIRTLTIHSLPIEKRKKLYRISSTLKRSASHFIPR